MGLRSPQCAMHLSSCGLCVLRYGISVCGIHTPAGKLVIVALVL